MSFIADRVVMDGLTFDDILLIPATFRATASKFSKVVICIRSFQQILYHSITAKVVVINIQASEAVIQGVFLYHSSITSDTGCFYQNAIKETAMMVKLLPTINAISVM